MDYKKCPHFITCLESEDPLCMDLRCPVYDGSRSVNRALKETLNTLNKIKELKDKIKELKDKKL